VDLGFEHETFGVHQDVALSAFDLLGSYSITALFSAHRGGLHRLRVHHPSAWLGIPSQADSQPFSDGPVDPLEGTVDAPFPEVAVDGGPPGEVVGKQAPLLAAAFEEVEEGV